MGKVYIIERTHWIEDYYKCTALMGGRTFITKKSAELFMWERIIDKNRINVPYYRESQRKFYVVSIDRDYYNECYDLDMESLWGQEEADWYHVKELPLV